MNDSRRETEWWERGDKSSTERAMYLFGQVLGAFLVGIVFLVVVLSAIIAAIAVLVKWVF